MMGTWLPETCWATIRRKIKNTKKWHLVGFFLSTQKNKCRSTVKVWTAYPFNFTVVADGCKIFLSSLGIARDQPAGKRLGSTVLESNSQVANNADSWIIWSWKFVRKMPLIFERVLEKPLWFHCIVWLLRLDWTLNCLSFRDSYFKFLISSQISSCNVQGQLLLNFLFLHKYHRVTFRDSYFWISYLFSNIIAYVQGQLILNLFLLKYHRVTFRDSYFRISYFFSNITSYVQGQLFLIILFLLK